MLLGWNKTDFSLLGHMPEGTQRWGGVAVLWSEHQPDCEFLLREIWKKYL